MPIEVLCPSCQSTLRVDYEHAGKKARCPQCQQVVPIPAGSTAPTADFPAMQAPGMAPPVNAQNPANGPISYQAPQQSHPPYPPHPGVQHSGLRPHRGETILIMGILSFVLCQFLAIPTLIMGSADSKAIKEGRMNPEGKGLVTAGLVLGWISLVLMVLSLLVFLIMFLAILGSAASV